MLMLGIIGEYIGRIYILLSNMPQYQVRDVINKNINEENILKSTSMGITEKRKATDSYTTKTNRRLPYL